MYILSDLIIFSFLPVLLLRPLLRTLIAAYLSAKMGSTDDSSEENIEKGAKDHVVVPQNINDTAKISLELNPTPGETIFPKGLPLALTLTSSALAMLLIALVCIH